DPASLPAWPLTGLSGGGEDFIEHALGEPTGEGVMLRDVMTPHYGHLPGAAPWDDLPSGPVAEFRTGPWHLPSEPGQRSECGLPCHTAQGENRRHRATEQFDLPIHPRSAGVPFDGAGPIVRRRAAHRGDDPGASQFQTVSRVQA